MLTRETPCEHSDTSAIISSGILGEGIFLCTLFVNGQSIGTKHLVKTKFVFFFFARSKLFSTFAPCRLLTLATFENENYSYYGIIRKEVFVKCSFDDNCMHRFGVRLYIWWNLL